MRYPIAVVFVAIILLFLSGCSQQGHGLGLKDAAECDNPQDGHIPRPSEQIACLHTAAITQASVFNDNDLAMDTCKEIFVRFAIPQTAGDETPEKAEVVTNNCLFDVAKITHQRDACGDIKRWRGGGASVFDNDYKTLAQTCNDMITRYDQNAPQNYFADPNKTNLCSVLAIFPLVIFATFFLNRKKN
ncbi:hypothetical protein HY988_03545 [Candidatus Micrarchaeota archaeon]|nr:hypothetical protein [Candidatus Micrarchaeota archaeon]